MGRGTDSRRVVEVEYPGGEADDPEVHAGGALETAEGAILVNVSKDPWERHLGLRFRARGDAVIQDAACLRDRAPCKPARGARRRDGPPDGRMDHTTGARRDIVRGEAKYLICDNDNKYGSQFEPIAKTSGIEVIHTPYAAPRANAICERFVGSLRRECLDQVLVIGGLQLTHILKEYVAYFNAARPHQGIGQGIPAPRVPLPSQSTAGKLMALPVLNGLHHDYCWAAA